MQALRLAISFKSETNCETAINFLCAAGGKGKSKDDELICGTQAGHCSFMQQLAANVAAPMWLPFTGLEEEPDITDRVGLARPRLWTW